MIEINSSVPAPDQFDADDLVCHCFQYTRKDIENDFDNNGKSLIYEKIALEKRGGGCDCALKNPRGKRCLSDVHQVVESFKKKRGR